MGAILARYWMIIRFYYDRHVRNHEYIKYKEIPLSAQTQVTCRTACRKTLVLDLDETLIHSSFDETAQFPGRHIVKKGTPCDFEFDVLLDSTPVHFYIFKRPHVDLFLDFVAKWYDLVVYTASLENYATKVLDRLDGGRGLFSQRFFRQHCRSIGGVHMKDLRHVSTNMANVLIIDNSAAALQLSKQNSIPIKTWHCDQSDKELLNLLPFLDALRCTKDVRSILERYENPLASRYWELINYD